MATQIELLTQEAKDLGIEVKGDETATQLKAAIKEFHDNKPALSDEEMADLKAASDAAEAKLNENKPEPVAEKKYSDADVEALLAKFKEHLKKEADQEEDDELDGKTKHTLRIPRMNKKFIVQLKNINDDPYFPNKVVYAQDIFNEQTRQMVPHVTAVFQDETTLTLPFETLIKAADSKTECEILETLKGDASYKYGTIERKEIKGDAYQEASTGDFVQGRAVQKKYAFRIKLPNGEELIVQPEVVNW